MNGYLIGPGADLTGANLSDADLTSAVLAKGRGTTAGWYQQADLNGVDLTNATLTSIQGLCGVLNRETVVGITSFVENYCD